MTADIIKFTPDEVDVLLRLLRRKIRYERSRVRGLPELQHRKVAYMESLEDKLERLQLSA